MSRLLVPALACALFLIAVGASSAAQIENKYFSVDLPEGWEELKLPKKQANPGLTLMFANKKINCAVSVSCDGTEMGAKEIAEMTRAKMKEGGLPMGPMEEKDGIYSYEMRKDPAKGWAFYGANGKEVAVITVWAKNLDAAKPFFDALKPADPAIFPKF